MTQLDFPGVAQVMLTTKQLAERWGVSAGALANDRFLGRSPVPYVKIGERVRYRLEDVLEFEAGARHIDPADRAGQHSRA
jgi:hypothetical protein